MSAEAVDLIVFCGPTASGKSAAALSYAKKYGGEIVSVDSMQLYRGLEIGTAQPTAEEQREIPHHLVGCFDLHERIDVLRYCQLAHQAIAAIRARGRLPILVGGTGLYLRTLLYGMDDLPADEALRKQLDEQFDHDGEAFEALCRKMRELDPAGLEKYGNCRRRLIRALEVKMLSGKSITQLQKNQERKSPYRFRSFLLTASPEELRSRIARRTRQMLDCGWIEEAQSAIANGLFASPTAHQALGYRQIEAYLQRRFDRAELTERIVTSTWQFARRQRTWFRHQEPQSEALEISASCNL